MITKSDIEKIILFARYEITIVSYRDYKIICELDIFNGHTMFYVRENDDGTEYDYYAYDDYEKAIDEFLECIRRSKKNE